MIFLVQIGESAGPECKAALQEVNSLVEQRLATDGKALKTLFGAAEVCILFYWQSAILYIYNHELKYT